MSFIKGLLILLDQSRITVCKFELSWYKFQPLWLIILFWNKTDVRKIVFFFYLVTLRDQQSHSYFISSLQPANG